jgi:hypothetical protein
MYHCICNTCLRGLKAAHSPSISNVYRAASSVRHGIQRYVPLSIYTPCSGVLGQKRKKKQKGVKTMTGIAEVEKGGIREPPGTRKGRGLKKGRAREAREERTCREERGPKYAAQYSRMVEREGLRGKCRTLELEKEVAGRSEGGMWRPRRR